MDSEDAKTIAYILGAPIYLWVLLQFVKSAKDWPGIMARWNERRRDREAAKDSDWKRLREEIERRDAQLQAESDRHAAEIARLDERCDHLQREVDECREREAVWMNRAIRAESAILGKGEVKQAAQLIVSAERQVDAAKREKGKP